MRPSRSRRTPRRRRAARRLALAATALAATLAAAGCGAPRVREVDTPLFSSDQVPDVLTEGRLVESPPSLAGNSFVRGWSPWREGKALHLVAQAGAVATVSVVSLEPRRRTLAFQGSRLVEGSPSAELAVTWDGESAGAHPVLAGEIPLPARGLGRVPLELALPPGVTLAVDGAELREALPAGRAEVRGEDLAQSGTSLVDVTDRLDGAATLVGRFEPPAGADASQSFTLLVESEGQEPVEAFRWTPGIWSHLLGARTLAVPLDGGCLVRLRFLARGTGPEATWRGLRLRRPAPKTTAEPPPPPPAPRVVLLYVMDALRADHVGHLGGLPGGSPTLDRLAAEGVVLARHQALAPNTLPSVKNLFTGRVFVDDGMASLPPPDQGPPVLAEIFGQAGYATGLFTGNGYVYHQANRGFAHVEPSVLFENAPPTGVNDNAERIHAAALRWLDGLPRERRVFLYLHAVNPHNPYQPPPELERRFAAGAASRLTADTETLLAIKRGRIPVTEADRERLRALYQAGVTYVDRELEELLAGLAARVPAAELLAVFTADHGEELFDHGGILHGYTLHREQLEVPLTFWWPGRLTPRRLETATDHLDLHATLRQLVEPEAPPPPGATSLWPLLTGEEPAARSRPRFAVAAGVPGGIFSAQSERGKLVWAPRERAGWGQGEGLGRSRDAVSLFDLATDPGEATNLAGAETVEVAWLRSCLLGWIARQREASGAAAEQAPTEEQRQNLEALGYVD